MSDTCALTGAAGGRGWCPAPLRHVSLLALVIIPLLLAEPHTRPMVDERQVSADLVLRMLRSQATLAYVRTKPAGAQFPSDSVDGALQELMDHEAYVDDYVRIALRKASRVAERHFVTGDDDEKGEDDYNYDDDEYLISRPVYIKDTHTNMKNHIYSFSRTRMYVGNLGTPSFVVSW